MKKMMICAALFAWPISTNAQLDEVRVGLSDQDVGWLGGSQIPGREKSTGLNLEAVFDKPDFFKWRVAPRPYVGGTVNLNGDTSYGGAGLTWRQGLGERFYGDFAFGLVVHDGTNNGPPPISADAFAIPPGTEIPQSLIDLFDESANTISFGSRVLFRQQLSLGVRVSDDWAVEGYVEHISNGGILNGDVFEEEAFLDGNDNDGLDAVGVRIAKRF